MCDEELAKLVSGDRLDNVDEMMRMLRPCDLGEGAKGKAEYKRLFDTYLKFGATGDAALFEEVCKGLKDHLGIIV